MRAATLYVGLLSLLAACVQGAPNTGTGISRRSVPARSYIVPRGEAVVHPDDVPPPRTDPFYLRPSNVSAYNVGDIVRSRVIEAQFKISGAGRISQLAYRTTNSQGHPSVTVTTVIEPAKGTKPKMMSYHLWEDSTNRNCAPSYTILKGKDSPNIKIVGDDVPVWWAFLLENGITVVVPDYEGPKSALFAGFTAGYAILDSARATIKYLNWPDNAKVTMTGYSEGAHVTAWAANLAPSYAPELNIVGVTHGGTPVDVENAMRHFDGTSFSGFTLGGLHGMSAAYPKFNRTLRENASPELLADLAEIYAPPICHADLRGPKFAGKRYLSSEMLGLGDDPYSHPVIKSILDRESMWANKSSVGVGYPKFPRLIYHGHHDDVISFEAVQHYINEQCQHPGVQIEFNIYEADAHTAPAVVIGGDLTSMQFILSVMEGTWRSRVPCGAATPTLLNAFTWGINNILGGNIAAGIETLKQQAISVGFHNMGFGDIRRFVQRATAEQVNDVIEHVKDTILHP